MREVKFTQSPPYGGCPIAMKLMCYFMRYILGYTNFAEGIGGTGSFGTHEKTGTVGSLTGSSFRFTDLTSKFIAGDVNKWLLIVDTVHPENCGWYRISAFVDADNVDIAFKTDPTEYPTAATGLTWYMVGETYDVPDTNQDYFRLRTPHIDGWEIELRYDTSSLTTIVTRMSLDQNWTSGGKILGDTWGTPSITAAEANYVNWYVEGDDAGDKLNIFSLYANGGSGDARCMCSIGRVIPWDTSLNHAPEELWVLIGPAIYSYGTWNKIVRLWDINYPMYWPNFYIWRNLYGSDYGAKKDGHLLEWSSGGYTDGFTAFASRQLNARRGVEDVMEGSHAIADFKRQSADNTKFRQFEYIGLVLGHQSVRSNLTAMQTINYAGGVKNRIHISGGILLPWPGFTPQHVP
jgi:hypothetical protein